jgi:hypothetical protein
MKNTESNYLTEQQCEAYICMKPYKMRDEPIIIVWYQ